MERQCSLTSIIENIPSNYGCYINRRLSCWPIDWIPKYLRKRRFSIFLKLKNRINDQNYHINNMSHTGEMEINLFLYWTKKKHLFRWEGQRKITTTKKRHRKTSHLSVSKTCGYVRCRLLIRAAKQQQKWTNKNMKNTTAFQLFYVNPKIK